MFQKSFFLRMRCLNVVFSVETCVFYSSFRINSLHNFDKSIKRWKKRLVYDVLKEDYGLNKVVLAFTFGYIAFCYWNYMQKSLS